MFVPSERLGSETVQWIQSKKPRSHITGGRDETPKVT